MANIKGTSSTVRALISLLADLDTLEVGRMVSPMEMVPTHGSKGINMLVSGKMGKNMGKGLTLLQMDQHMWVNLNLVSSMEEADTNLRLER